jgi:predicted dehydrogenase (TIGR03970 family)
LIDVLIIGAGSAGCVLAERVSADPSCRVTLVEAGPAWAPADDWVLPIGPDSPVSRHHRTTLTHDPHQPVGIVRGAVVGGSGAVNGGYFCRAAAADFDTWALPGWSWDEVLPHYRAIETDRDFTGPEHGQAGPIPVRRTADFGAAARAFIDGAAAAYQWIDDLNGANGERRGIGAVPLNVADSQFRHGPGEAFLVPALGRPNLTLLTGTKVLRVLFDQDRVAGIACSGPDGEMTLHADRIVLCAGAIESAHVLMLSGVGPAGELRAAGLPVVADLPVGANTADHPEWVVPVDWPGTAGRPPVEVLLTDGGLEIRPYTCGFAAMTGSTADMDPVHIGISLMRPKSRGRVRLVSADPRVPPVIEHRYHADPADAAVLGAGYDRVRELFGATTTIGDPSWSTAQHLSATAPMGTEGQEWAVVDPRCRVLGIDGLWVVDGSILPDITGRGPHATIVMIGHRAAEFVSG